MMPDDYTQKEYRELPIMVKNTYNSLMFPDEVFEPRRLSPLKFEADLYNMTITFSLKRDSNYDFEITMFLIAWALNDTMIR